MALITNSKHRSLLRHRRALNVQKLDPRVVFAAELDLVVNLGDNPASASPGQVVVPDSAIVWNYQVTNSGNRPVNGLRLLQDAGTPAIPSDDIEPIAVPSIAAASAVPSAGTLLATFESTNVRKMVVDPWQPRLYASVLDDDSVSIFNTETSTRIRSVNLNYQPNGLTLSRDSSVLYVAAFSESRNRGRIFVLDANDLDEIDTINVAGKPSDVRVGADGRLIVLTDSELLQIDPATGELISDAVPIGFSRGELAISPQRDRLYIASIGAPWASLTQYDLTADPPTVLWQSPLGSLTGSNGQDLSISQDGRFVSYAAGNGQGGYRIAKYNTLPTNNAETMTIDGYFETGAFPREVIYSPDDTVAYTVSQSGRITGWDTNTFESIVDLSVSGEARELNIDSSGRFLYAAFDGELRVYSTGRAVATNIGDSNENGLLDPNETWSYTSQSNAVAGRIQTTTLATGIDSQGTPVTTSEVSYYTGESISVLWASTLQGESITPNFHPLHAVGQQLTWRHSISNTGTVALSQVAVTRDADNIAQNYLAGDINNNEQLDPNETWIYEVREPAIAGLQSRALQLDAVSSNPDAPVALTDSQTIGYFGVDARIQTSSSINGHPAAQQPGPEIGVGDPATLVYQVSNTGNATFASLDVIENAGTNRIDDDTSPTRIDGDSNANDQLDPGETWVYLIDQTSVAGAQQRKLTITTTDPLNRDLNIETFANYVGVGGNVDLVTNLILPEVTSPHAPTGSPLVPAGDTIRFQYLVTNAGTLPLGLPQLTDDGSTPNDSLDDLTPFRVNEDLGADGILSPGETWDFRVSLIAGEGLRSHRSSVSMTPVDELGQALDNTNPVFDATSLDYFGGTIDIEANIRAAGTTIASDRDDLFLADTMIQLTYEVTNTGNVAIGDVNVVQNPADETETPRPTIELAHTTQTGLSPRGTVLAEFANTTIHRFVPHPTLPYVFASDVDGNRVLKINTNTLQIEQAYEMGRRPRGMSLSPDGTRLYVAHETSQTIAALDIVNNELLPSLSIAQIPRDVQVGSDGRLYVLGHRDLMQLDPETGEAVGPTLPVTVLGGEIAINPERTRLYYSNSNLTPASLYQINLTTSIPTILYQSPTEGGEGGNGQTLALSADGSLVAHGVSLPPNNSGQGNSGQANSGQANSGQGSAGQGSVVVTVRNTSDMSVAGQYVLADRSPGIFTQEVAFDPDGRFAYAVSQANLISVFGATTFAQTSAIGIQGTADEMEVDSTGRFLFASVDNRLVIYSTGRATSTINQGDVNFNRSFDPGETWLYGSASLIEPGSGRNEITAVATGPFGRTIASIAETDFVGGGIADVNAMISGTTVYDEELLPDEWVVSDDRFEISDGNLKLRDGQFLTGNDNGLEITLRANDTTTRIERSIVVNVNDVPAWQNQQLREDVNNDGIVTALDALIIINRLDANAIDTNTIESNVVDANQLGARPDDFDFYYDVTGDSLVTALDALRVINAINASDVVAEAEPAPRSVDAGLHLLNESLLEEEWTRRDEERKRRQMAFDLAMDHCFATF